mmetsp:Transcript_11894/g.24596  ORF Transcript_11894/g.24596 Transcript_11894/m.24596 type:complete len:167 (-) Transcript_11894:46-546(-)
MNGSGGQRKGMVGQIDTVTTVLNYGYRQTVTGHHDVTYEFLRRTSTRRIFPTSAAGLASLGTYIGELDNTKTAKVGQAVVRGVLIDDEGDVLHLLGAEPPSHGCWSVWLEPVAAAVEDWLLAVALGPLQNNGGRPSILPARGAKEVRNAKIGTKPCESRPAKKSAN